jgi:2-phosphosulfolactate phosphatase
VGSQQVYLACLRNFTAVAEYASKRHKNIAIIGAGTRGVFRREDQMGCAWTAARLLEMGFKAENDDTEELIRRWSSRQADSIREGRSADYLRRTGQIYDLEFIINHIDDLNLVPVLRDKIVMDAEQK